ncbi:serine-rich adhesin for platelets-like [Littorina saxatilis]|uniref:serine-rich adhesin for platelets-like n=1 Tax=Littorina saxatilis TaxID=31220 RepID=UPI0038B5B5C6
MADAPAFRDNGFPNVNVGELTALDEPDFDQMRDDRSQRTRQAMRTVDASLTSQILPQSPVAVSQEDQAAVCIQKHYRGYLGRKAYTQQLYLQFEQEERERQEKMLQQVEEGELLVENHKLEVLLDEGQTVRRNRDRHHICKVITIQRAWRAYRDRKSQCTNTPTHTPTPQHASNVPHHKHPRHLRPRQPPLDDEATIEHTIDRIINLDDIHITDDDDDSGEDSDTESAAGTRTMTLSTPEENQDRYGVEGRGQRNEGQSQRVEGQGRERSRSSSQLRVPPLPPAVTRNLADSECESVVSDYSELGGPLKDLESDLELVDREELRNYTSPFLPDSLVQSYPSSNSSAFFSPSRSSPSHPSSSSLLTRSVCDATSYQRRTGECEGEYQRRIRKLNFLSLAQEFAELKRVNADANPLDFHLSQSGLAKPNTSSDKRGSLSEADQCLELDSTDGTMEKDSSSERGRTAKPASAKAESQASASANGESQASASPAKGDNSAATSAKGDKSAATSVAKGDKSATVVMRDHSARRGILRTQRREGREGSTKRNSHHGGTHTPTTLAQEARSSPGLERRFSQPVEGDFEVFTMDSSVPAMNWDLFEEQLQLAAEEERKMLEARQTDREEIRRKLAMGTDEDYYGGERAFKKPSLSARLQGGMNLQICFMNDAAAAGDDPDVTSSGTAMTSQAMTTLSSQSHHNLSWAATSVCSASSSSSTSPFPSSSQSSSSTAASHPSQSSQSSKSRPKSDPGLLASQLSLPPLDESPAERQQRLQQEARMALAQASTMARMQLEVERKTKKKSPIAQIVGVPELGEGRGRMKISRKLLYEMNLAQLQVLVNDLHTQIENLNEELVHLLIERDDLHMEQDSQLVDIEDLTSFAQHMSETNNNKSTQNNRNSSVLSKKLK